MTMEDAKKINELLLARQYLERELRDITQCSVILAEVCAENSGYTLRWENGKSLAIEYLKEGYQKEVDKIDSLIASLDSPNFPESST
jgi:hypothetical protein